MRKRGAQPGLFSKTGPPPPPPLNVPSWEKRGSSGKVVTLVREVEQKMEPETERSAEEEKRMIEISAGAPD